jgi:hypothetical protein
MGLSLGGRFAAVLVMLREEATKPKDFEVIRMEYQHPVVGRAQAVASPFRLLPA